MAIPGCARGDYGNHALVVAAEFDTAIAPITAPNMACNDYGEKLFIGNVQRLLKNRPGTIKPFSRVKRAIAIAP